ncbi:MAG: hypothetical protein CMM49_01485 [Rhodospirillaceae bacterium]|nr:hypothetical protein [Rhodospirillaceae bacterium]
MRVLIRYLTKKRDGAISSRDEEINAETISFGRGSSNEVILQSVGVLLIEGSIHHRNSEFFYEVDGAGGNTLIDGFSKRSSLIKSGSIITIGPYDIKILETVKDFDLVISVELVREVQTSLKSLKTNSRTRIDQVLFGKRSYSWAFAIIILSVFLIWPVADRYILVDTNLGKKSLEKKHWPSNGDIAWTSGEISGSHKFIGNDCSVCHEKPFQQVKNTVCSSCHSEVGQHVEPDGYQDMKNITEASCQSCHKEHQGNMSIVRSDQSFCANCHTQIEKIALSSNLKNVSDFEKNHPQFSPTVITNATKGTTERISLDREVPPKENSNLYFPHDTHMKGTGVFVAKTGETKILGCADCHVQVGNNFMPIRMDEHCSDCHLLNFDADQPARLLPHADFNTVKLSLREFYSDLALRGFIKEQKVEESINRRRPGNESKVTEEQKYEALEWAEMKAKRIILRITNRAACGSCHNILTINEDTDDYKIAPVLVTDRWLPKGMFNHAKHTVSDCSSCHLVSNSSSSSDVLLPKVETCQNCHGGEKASQKVPSTCISCHEFHLPHKGKMNIAGNITN